MEDKKTQQSKTKEEKENIYTEYLKSNKKKEYRVALDSADRND